MTLDYLTELSRVTRVDTVKELWKAQSGHPGSSLSALDVMVHVYNGGFLQIDPKNPQADDRDIFVLSVGHAAPGLYATLAVTGFFPREELSTLRQLDSRLEGHVKRGGLPGVEASAGSLGQGLGFGTGVAMAQRARHANGRKVVVLMSDGEQQEGSTWESVMFAGSHGLENLVAFVDINRNQINGPTHDIMPIMDELQSKYSSFGWSAVEIDGNDHTAIGQALAGRDAEKPTVILSHTVTGKGIPYMEGDFHWHHGVITNDKFVSAMEALGESVSPSPDETWEPGVTALPTR